MAGCTDYDEVYSTKILTNGGIEQMSVYGGTKRYEVKYGHWLSVGFGEYWCSVCDANGEDVLVKRGNPNHKYCHHCGAKMDGGKAE